MRERGLWSVVLVVLVVLVGAGAAEASYKLPPTGAVQWYWEINPPAAGVAGLPAFTGAYPAPGSANIWDTDLFQDSNVQGAGVPTGPSPVVAGIHGAGHYSICYVEAGAYQVGFPDDQNFAVADYGGVGDKASEMQGYPGEYWFNLTGFARYAAGQAGTLTGAAVDIASQLDKRFAGCKLEGQDAVEPDDLDGYTNQSQSGVTPWGMTQADSAGFERWLAYDIHAHGLAAFQKNDPANAAQNASLFDGMIIEECNYYQDPCTGSGGDASAYLAAGKPVLNAEYVGDGETTAKFCSADITHGITGALFNVNLSGGTYQPCAPAGASGSPAPRPRLTRATVDDQRITLITPSPQTCIANTRSLAVTLGSTRIANAKGAKLRFASATFSIDSGSRRRGAHATAHRVPVRLRLSLAGLGTGVYTLTVRIVYRVTGRTHGHQRTVPMTRTLRAKFDVC
jgi:hypothetical protein